MFKSQYKTLFQGSECPKFSLWGWKNMFQTLTFRAQECSRLALSGKRMFPTLTFGVEESSRFSPLGLKNAQDSLNFRVEECSRFSIPGSKNVQDSQFQDPRMFKILSFSLEEECLDKILCFREEPGCSKVWVSGKKLLLGPEGELQWQIQCASRLHVREKFAPGKTTWDQAAALFSSKNI